MMIHSNNIGFRLFVSFFLVAGLVSCTEKIDINVNGSDPQIVIEGNIGTNGAQAIIKIHKSNNFDESNEFPAIQNATVTLNDNDGNSEVLTETTPGIYVGKVLLGIAGRKYDLQVEVADELLTATSTIPLVVKFDSLIMVKDTAGNNFGPGSGGPGSGGGQPPSEENTDITTFTIYVQYVDPTNTKNYYRFLEYVNGNLTTSYLFNDKLTNGNDVESSLVNFNRNFNIGDTVKVEMQCIDEKVFDFYKSFESARGGPISSSTPANPITNINGSQLGYFSAHTVQTRQIIIE